MGRPPRQSGAQAIHDAERLFRQSAETGHPDFAYVALAIGNAPQSPPTWAIIACIELRQQLEGAPARGNSLEIEQILDDIVRLYDRTQRLFDRPSCNGSLKAPDSYRPPSLRSAIRRVCKVKGYRIAMLADRGDDWWRDIRNAWEWEQTYDLASSSFFDLEEGKIDQDGKISGQKRWLQTTSRIARVLQREQALRNGDPEDLTKWAWITKVLVQNEMIDQQRPDKPET